MPLLGEIGISKVQLGAFLTAGGIVYGVGRFLNGIVADRHSARKVMATGLFICSALNILFGLSDVIAGVPHSTAAATNAMDCVPPAAESRSLVLSWDGNARAGNKVAKKCRYAEAVPFGKIYSERHKGNLTAASQPTEKRSGRNEKIRLHP